MSGLSQKVEQCQTKGAAFLSGLGDRSAWLWGRYKMRLQRRRYLFRSWRSRRQLKHVTNRTADILPRDILLFSTVRNERQRLPYFFSHYRALGVNHFLFVVNDADDGTLEYLQDQPDTSVWTTSSSYKSSRFGVDWLTFLQMKFGHSHWCLTADADELLIYPHYESRPLPALTDWLDHMGEGSFGAMMLDLYPKGPIGKSNIGEENNPLSVLNWFDAGNYSVQVQQPKGNLWIQGGPRARMFFADKPKRSPTLNKVPLVRWNRRFAYVNSSHSALPPKLNQTFATDGGEKLSGILLHTKFLDSIVVKSKEEKSRGEHFNNSELYADYYDALTEKPVLWCKQSQKYKNWQQLEQLGLLSSGGWA